MSVKVHVQQGLLGKNRVTHNTFVDHSAEGKETQIEYELLQGTILENVLIIWWIWWCTHLACPPVSVGCWVLMWL